VTALVTVIESPADLPPGVYRLQDDPPRTGIVYRYDCRTWEAKTGQPWARWFVEVEK
jgi:hypothetical protein